MRFPTLSRKLLAMVVGAFYGGALSVVFWLTNDAFQGGLPVPFWLLPLLVVVGAFAGLGVWKGASHPLPLIIAAFLAVVCPYGLSKFAMPGVVHRAPPQWIEWLKAASDLRARFR